MEESSCYASKLAWIWVIEALASFKEVNISILHGIMIFFFFWNNLNLNLNLFKIILFG
jgi:hypothetical protein